MNTGSDFLGARLRFSSCRRSRWMGRKSYKPILALCMFFNPNETDEQRAGARWLWRLHAWIMGIGWTDMGTAFALIVIGNICINDGHGWRGLWCWMLGITVYVRAPRPPVQSEPTRQATLEK